MEELCAHRTCPRNVGHVFWQVCGQWLQEHQVWWKFTFTDFSIVSLGEQDSAFHCLSFSMHLWDLFGDLDNIDRGSFCFHIEKGF